MVDRIMILHNEQDNYPLISVIVPVYNVENYIQQCIESILNQTYTNWELILVNDGSTDNSGAICDRFAKENARVKIIHQKNAGVSVARNNALNVAKGEYITFVDSDDWVEKDYLLSFVKYPLSDDCIVCQGVLHDHKDKTTIFSWNADANYVIRQNSADKEKEIWNTGYICSKLFSKSIIDRNGLRFDEILHLHEDHIFFYEYLLNVRRIILLTYAGYHYRHQNNASLSKTMQSSSNYFLSSDMFLKLYPKLEYHFGTLNSYYIANCVQMFGLNQIMMGIFSLYLENCSQSIRLNILREKKIYRNYFKKYYHCKTLKTKIFYFIYIYFPAYIQDYIFQFLSSRFANNIKTSINIK
jgi:glycosyltransferase involved in cell wall biosynthesis